MKRSYYFVFAAILFCFCVMTSQAQAQATRTWVSGLGDDANPCSRTAPCKTFAGAMSKTADCGEIDALDPAGYGAVTMTKGVKIDGGGGEAGQVASILASSGVPAVVINNSSVTCQFDVLRNLDIQGVQTATIGVNIVQGSKISIENVDIENFSAQCINMQPTNAVTLVVYSSNLENCAQGGLLSSTTSGTNRFNIEKSTIQRNGLTANAGVKATSNTLGAMHNTMINNNAGGGVEATGATSKIAVDHSQVSNNQNFGLHSGTGAQISVTNTSIYYNNGIGMLVDGGAGMLTGTNNWLAGNVGGDGSKTGSVTIL